MPYDFPERDDWADAVAAAVLAAGRRVRDRIVARVTAYGRTIPSDPAVLYQRSWWDTALRDEIEPAMRAVAADAADAFAVAAGVELPKRERDEIAVAVAATVAALLVDRGGIVGDRVETLVGRGLEEGWNAERFMAELGVDDPDNPGPLSLALLGEIGVAAALMSGHSAVSTVAARRAVTGEKEWRTVGDSRVRSSHQAVDGVKVSIDEQFIVGGYPGNGPHDPALPVSEIANCRCSIVYRFDKDDRGNRGRFTMLGHCHPGGVLTYAQEVVAVSDTMQAPTDETPDESSSALGDVSEDELIAELARRAADRVPADVDPDLAEEVMAEHVAEAVEDIAEETAEEEVEGEGDHGEAPEGMMMPMSSRVVRQQIVREGLTFTVEMPTESLRLFNLATFAVIGDADLPLADRDLEWDGSAAAQRVADWARGDGEDIDPERYGRAFFWRDDEADATNVTAYKLGFADVVDGELRAVPRAVFAVAAVLKGGRGGVDIPDADADRVRARVSAYYERMADEFGDDTLEAPFAITGDRGTEFAVDGVPDGPTVTEFDGEGILCVEGVMSGDGRMMAEESLTWRHLPVPLAFLEKITQQHQEGEFCGWIHQVERRGNAIWGKFTLEDNAAGNRLREILANPKGAGRYGVSVDIDAATVVYADADGNVMDMIDVQDAVYAGEDVVQLMIEGRIIGATCVMHPAFQEANVWLIDTDPEPTEALVASVTGRAWRTLYVNDTGALRAAGSDDIEALVASAGVASDAAAPPARYFDLAPMPDPVAFEVHAPDGDGVERCYGLVAQWGDCHVGYPDRCITVPRSPDFSSFYGEAEAWREFYGGPALSRFYAGNKQVLTREGKLVQVGPVILDTVHPSLRMKASDAQAFYAHTGSAVADVRLYVNEHGIVAAGVIRPDADPVQVRKLRASDVSPDWRMVGGELKIMALLAVNVSGFQIEGLAASAGQFKPWAAVDEVSGEVVALVAAGAVRQPRPTRMAAEVEALRAELAQAREENAALADAFLALSRRVNRAIAPIERRALDEARATLGLAADS